MISFSEVKTYLIAPIEIHEDVLNFKLDIIKKGQNQFHGQLWRLEMYRVQPSFHATDVQADEAIYVQDTHTLIDLDEQIFNSENECLDFVLSGLKKRFL